MSYAVGDSKPKSRGHSYQQVQPDEENMSNPLLGQNFRGKVTGVEAKMKQIREKLKTLEGFHRQIGTTDDNQRFRNKVQETLKDTGLLLKDTTDALQDLQDVSVPPAQMKQKRDQVGAFQETQKILAKKLKDIGLKI